MLMKEQITKLVVCPGNDQWTPQEDSEKSFRDCSEACRQSESRECEIIESSSDTIKR